MILVSGTMTVDPADRARALALFEAVARETRREPGCNAYFISWDIDHPSRFRVIEEWASLADLNAHLTTPHIAAFMAGLADLRLQGVSMYRYEVTSKKKVV